jgi:hypothetical protein
MVDKKFKHFDSHVVMGVSIAWKLTTHYVGGNNI